VVYRSLPQSLQLSGSVR